MRAGRPLRSGSFAAACAVGVLDGLLASSSGRAIAVLLTAGAMVLASSVAFAENDYQRAFALAAGGRLAAANRTLVRAEHWFPDFSNLWFTNADLLRHWARTLPVHDPARGRLAHLAWQDLARAERLNPWQPQTFVIRAALLSQEGAWLGPHADAAALRAVHQALARDPRFYPARILGARILLAAHHMGRARRLLEAGRIYWYPADATRYRRWLRRFGGASPPAVRWKPHFAPSAAVPPRGRGL